MPDIVDMLQALPHAVTPGPAGPDLAAADVARGHRALRQRRRHRLAGAAGTVAVGAVAVVLAITSAPRAAAPAAAPARPASQAPAAPPGSASQPPAAPSKLISLAALIKASDNGPLPGNASLVIAKRTNGGQLLQVVYSLYTDSGAMYTAGDKSALIRTVDQNANLAGGIDSREVAAARYAAAGDLATARVRMVNTAPNCWGIGLSTAAQQKIWARCARRLGKVGKKVPLQRPTGRALQADFSNDIWFDCQDALSWVGADPQIREGVLRLLSTIPDITVANSTTGGQPTLTITARPALVGNGIDQVLTVNARTGLPVSFVQSHGGSTDVETDRVSRLTLANIKAGKF